MSTAPFEAMLARATLRATEHPGVEWIVDEIDGDVRVRVFTVEPRRHMEVLHVRSEDAAALGVAAVDRAFDEWIAFDARRAAKATAPKDAHQ